MPWSVCLPGLPCTGDACMMPRAWASNFSCHFSNNTPCTGLASFLQVLLKYSCFFFQELEASIAQLI